MDEAAIVAKVVAELRKFREEHGISQYRLSKDTGLSPSGIRHMENGDVSPTLYFLLRVSLYLNVDLATLVSKAQIEQEGKSKQRI